MLDKVYACCVTHRLFWSRKPHERHREQRVHQRLGRFRRTFCFTQCFSFKAQGKRKRTQRDPRLPQCSSGHLCTLDHTRYLCFQQTQNRHIHDYSGFHPNFRKWNTPLQVPPRLPSTSSICCASSLPQNPFVQQPTGVSIMEHGRCCGMYSPKQTFLLCKCLSIFRSPLHGTYKLPANYKNCVSIKCSLWAVETLCTT